MKKIILLFAFLALHTTETTAQPPEGHDENLVPNPDFEALIGRRPESDVDGSGIFRYNMVAWKSPTMTTPDVKIGLPSDIKRAKRDGIDLDKPHSGYKMVAILTHNPESERDDTYREYIQVKLKKPLIKGQEYYCEFWVCRARLARYVSNNIGVALSPTRLSEEGWKPLTNIVPDYNYDELINPKKREWQRISFTFISPNRSEYLCIGNFFNNEKTKMVEVEDPIQATVDEKAFNNAYYLIDDVMLCATSIPEPEPEPEPEPVAPPPAVGAVIKLDRVFFETAKWALLPESHEQLDELVSLMNEYPSMEIEIHGHTDSRGDNDYNQNLSENRTKSVYEYLVDQGIDASRMQYIGYGESKPIANNKYADGRQLNRRVEFVVTHIDAENTVIEHSNEVTPYTDND
ncbi:MULTISPECIES: OmpA family protein [unclassified Aureispira]|uniref:OmpA family protein n=1 Tax=unclassified Aureispira TaxID=2649989 RepID=UPI0006985EB2|nr:MULTISPECIES: OmpA family protein [unclassified Aureispira]WMX12717.1 OmpA family protein [Aureispira sp. CCB-E]